MRPALHRTLAAITAALLCTSAHGEPPRVVSCNVETGDEHVDPALAEIMVGFDRDMNTGGYSWCGGTATFPKLTGQPVWETPRVCTLPVALEPGVLYYISINSPYAHAFMSTEGEPAEVDEIIFRTTSAGDDDGPEAVRVQNRASAATLDKLIRTRYSYLEQRGVDWPELFESRRAELDSCDSRLAFALRAADLLGAFRDLHMSVELDGLYCPTFRREPAYNANFALLDRSIKNPERLSNVVVCGELGDDIGYIAVHSWDRGREGEVRAWTRAYERLKAMDALVIDVRANSGGDEMLARELAGCFVAEPVEYAQAMVVDETGQLTGPHVRVLEPNTEHQRFKGRVVVLTGPAVMSSCEAFVLMMKQSPRCTIVGGATFGSSGNPRPHELPNGVVVNIPSWRAMTMDGEVFEGIGISPDVRVDADDFSSSDPVLDKAIELLDAP